MKYEASMPMKQQTKMIETQTLSWWIMTYLDPANISIVRSSSYLESELDREEEAHDDAVGDADEEAAVLVELPAVRLLGVGATLRARVGARVGVGVRVGTRDGVRVGAKAKARVRVAACQ
eukprot:scaffold52041_cov51-Phaeocystis_antarctica.AAC.2